MTDQHNSGNIKTDPIVKRKWSFVDQILSLLSEEPKSQNDLNTKKVAVSPISLVPSKCIDFVQIYTSE